MVATPRWTRQRAAPEGDNGRPASKLDTSVYVALIAAAATIIAALITAIATFIVSSPNGTVAQRPFSEPFTPAEPNSVTPKGTECSANLLSKPWRLEATGGAAEDWIDFDPPFKPQGY
jgi:hypothetical protein